MLVFALLIFTLFIQLTISSSKEEIKLLITLGAAPKQLYRFLIKQFFPVNALIIIGVLILIQVLQTVLQQLLTKQNIYISSFISPYTIVAAIIILLVLAFVNSRTIKMYIGKND